MNDEYLTPEEDLLNESLEDAAEQQSYLSGAPIPLRKDTVFKFFKELLNNKDSSKFANLSTAELGNPKLSIRAYQSIALYAKEEELNTVSNYLMKEGEITLATSLSKKGFLSQLFVTQIKKEQKVKPVTTEKKWFSKGE